METLKSKIENVNWQNLDIDEQHQVNNFLLTLKVLEGL